jgi:hypothetical protein
MLAFFLGGVLVAGGATLAKLAFAGPVAGVLATETEGAVEVTASAVGRGLRAGMAGGAVGTVVKVKCRSCGYLETEDAKFCSQCSTAL